jgi:hypothetical protein
MKLAGITIIRNNYQFDYHVFQTIRSLRDFCDKVFVLDCGSTDGTLFDLQSLVDTTNIFACDEKVELLTADGWDDFKGKERLAHFTNIVTEHVKSLGYDYQCYLQSDEIIHESSYRYIAEALKTGKDGFMCSRINLWGSPYRQLIVPEHRQPCSTRVLRFTKAGMMAYDDAENIGCDNPDMSFVDKIVMYHMGFVRNRYVMKAKISNMQKNVFGMEHHDPKLDAEELFNPWLWFDKERDTQIINNPLPYLIQDWAKQRAEGYE